jgi:hypothetical protein
LRFKLIKLFQLLWDLAQYEKRIIGLRRYADIGMRRYRTPLLWEGRNQPRTASAVNGNRASAEFSKGCVLPLSANADKPITEGAVLGLTEYRNNGRTCFFEGEP